MLGRCALVPRVLKQLMECTGANQASKGPRERRGTVAISAARAVQAPASARAHSRKIRSTRRGTRLRDARRAQSSSGWQFPQQRVSPPSKRLRAAVSAQRFTQRLLRRLCRRSAVKESGEAQGSSEASELIQARKAVLCGGPSEVSDTVWLDRKAGKGAYNGPPPRRPSSGRQGVGGRAEEANSGDEKQEAVGSAPQHQRRRGPASTSCATEAVVSSRRQPQGSRRETRTRRRIRGDERRGKVRLERAAPLALRWRLTKAKPDKLAERVAEPGRQSSRSESES